MPLQCDRRSWKSLVNGETTEVRTSPYMSGLRNNRAHGAEGQNRSCLLSSTTDSSSLRTEFSFGAFNPLKVAVVKAPGEDAVYCPLGKVRTGSDNIPSEAMPHSLPPQKKTNSASTAFRTFIMRGVPTRGGRATKLSGLTPLTCAGEDVLILDSQNEHPVNGIIWSLHRGHRIRFSTFLETWMPFDTCLGPRPVLLSNLCRRTTAITTIVTIPKITKNACM